MLTALTTYEDALFPPHWTSDPSRDSGGDAPLSITSGKTISNGSRKSSIAGISNGGHKLSLEGINKVCANTDLPHNAEKMNGSATKDLFTGTDETKLKEDRSSGRLPGECCCSEMKQRGKGCGCSGNTDGGDRYW